MLIFFSFDKVKLLLHPSYVHKLSDTPNSSRPRPLHSRATCRAAQAKKPASSRIREMTISATKVKVASQTMPHTVATSCNCTTPANRAVTAPASALQPMPRPRGCQITRASVRMKIVSAGSMRNYSPWKFVADSFPSQRGTFQRSLSVQLKRTDSAEAAARRKNACLSAFPLTFLWHLCNEVKMPDGIGVDGASVYWMVRRPRKRSWFDGGSSSVF